MASQISRRHRAWDPVNITWKRDCTGVIKWADLGWGRSPGLCRWAHCDHSGPSDGCGGGEMTLWCDSEMAVMQKLEWCTLKMEKWPQFQGIGSHETLKKARNQVLPSQPLEGAGLLTSGPIRDLICGNYYSNNRKLTQSKNQWSLWSDPI